MNVKVKNKGDHIAPCGTPADTANTEDCPSAVVTYRNVQINMM